MSGLGLPFTLHRRRDKASRIGYSAAGKALQELRVHNFTLYLCPHFNPHRPAPKFQWRAFKIPSGKLCHRVEIIAAHFRLQSNPMPCRLDSETPHHNPCGWVDDKICRNFRYLSDVWLKRVESVERVVARWHAPCLNTGQFVGWRLYAGVGKLASKQNIIHSATF